MRLWSIHPRYLDAKGLVALWREGLLAQKVLLGQTKGYKNHPQLIRFQEVDNSLGAIASYLRHVQIEAEQRGYKFDKNKIINKSIKSVILVNNGQIRYEFNHLLNKLKQRDPALYKQLRHTKTVKLHPLFKRRNGGIEEWEIIT